MYFVLGVTQTFLSFLKGVKKSFSDKRDSIVDKGKPLRSSVSLIKSPFSFSAAECFPGKFMKYSGFTG